MSHCTWNCQHIWNRFRMFTLSETRSRTLPEACMSAVSPISVRYCVNCLYISCHPSLSDIVSTPEAWSCFAHLCQVLCQLLKPEVVSPISVRYCVNSWSYNVTVTFQRHHKPFTNSDVLRTSPQSLTDTFVAVTSLSLASHQALSLQSEK